MKKRKQLEVRVGDIVRINLSYPSARAADKEPFVAKVLELHEDFAQGNKIKYQRLDGIEEDFNLCNVSYIEAVEARAPYAVGIKMPKNIFTGYRSHFNLRVAGGGVRCGSLVSLACEALSTVRHVDLAYSLNEHRTEELYRRAGWPGMTAAPADCRHFYNLAVNWKAFRRWVHNNAQLLIDNKKEAIADAIAFDQTMRDDLADVLSVDMQDDLWEDDYFSHSYGEPDSQGFYD